MRGTIRSNEQVIIEESARSAVEATEKIESQVQPGFELISAHRSMSKAGQDVSVRGVARSTATREIEGADLSDLRALTPEGWQLLNVIA